MGRRQNILEDIANGSSWVTSGCVACAHPVSAQSDQALLEALADHATATGHPQLICLDDFTLPPLVTLVR
jgi:hypothetical protein